MQIWNRRSTRLRGYDYCGAGYYFITICTNGKEKVFGKIERKMMILNDLGKIAQNEWIKTAQIRAYVRLDVFKIMPDHMHGILVIIDDQYRTVVGATGPVAPTITKTASFARPKLKPASLGSIIGQFKSVVTKKIRKNGKSDFKWQRGFYDHVIRNEKDLFILRKYIMDNPSKN